MNPRLMNRRRNNRECTNPRHTIAGFFFVHTFSPYFVHAGERSWYNKCIDALWRHRMRMHILSYMHDLGRKILIHVRSPQKKEDSHAHKRAKAHLHTHAHTVHKILPEIKRDTTPLAPPETPPLAALEQPIVIEGINMHALHVAYFCMEIGLDTSIPTYAGGLGILAGDTLKSAADLDVSMIGVTLLYRKGYFHQRFDESGWQLEDQETWNPYEKLTLLPKEVLIQLEGREVRVRAWLYKRIGIGGNIVPVIFLDTDVEGNAEEDRLITDSLYSGDHHHRIKQEAVLGIAGFRMVEALGATHLEKYHMNEGHSALLTIELYRQYADAKDPIEEVRKRTVFTTHTPVPAGHDRFGEGDVRAVLGADYVPASITPIVFPGGTLNMTRLGLQFSGHINGVAKRHGEVMRELFPGYRIESITNGVYAKDWIAPPLATLFDKYLPAWQADPYMLRYALSIPGEELYHAHMAAKQSLVEFVNEKHNAQMNLGFFTIGFARRAASYKRGNMLFADIERLMRIAEHSHGIQIIFAGKAHPGDHDGKMLIQQIIGNMSHVAHKIHCVYLPDYDMEMAKILVSGVDIWLNTPLRPQEASGTSGMKAALNGVPQFSVLDGWWLEGHIENATGWSIGPHPEQSHEGDVDVDAVDIEDMYAKLEHTIIPMYENNRAEWIRVMRQAIAINGSFFNTHRMLEQYVLTTYFK